MSRRHVTRKLSAYHHEALSPGERLQVEAHLEECSKCRSVYEEIRIGARFASVLRRSVAPESIWENIGIQNSPHESGREFFGMAVAGLAVTAALVAGLFLHSYVRDVPSWDVAIRGTARIGSSHAANSARLRAGEALQTDATSEAQVKIANIGELNVDPDSRIRLIVSKSDQHRIALERGSLQALTWAPPRLFIVETPSATAIDLGCKYTLNVEDDGSSLLHVTLGLVALELRGRETVVPAGAFCRTRPGAGPGTPYFEDASKELQAALDYVDFGKDEAERDRRLEIVLRESHVRDALTLWHLIPRLAPQSRGLVYDRLAGFLPPPSGVTRDGIVALDQKMLELWQPVIAQLWQ
jgi:hypothetical protein